MKTILLTALLLLATGPMNHAALVRYHAESHPKSIPPAPHGHKFLFVMDVSKSMVQFEEGGRPSLFQLIYSGLDGYLQIGDSFGLWAVNDRLITGVYPMQVWDPTNRLYLATSATNYISSIPSEGRTHLEYVTRSLSNIVESVNDLNVIIVSDGRSDLKGTAFDQPINNLYEKRYREAKKEGQPLVTALMLRNKQMVSAQVVLAEEPIELPTRPAPLPWPPPPTLVEEPTATANTDNLARSDSNRARASAKTSGRTIMITQQTIQRDREKLLASLNADFSHDRTHASTPSIQPKPAIDPEPVTANAATKSVTTPNAEIVDSHPSPADRPTSVPILADRQPPASRSLLTALLQPTIPVSAREAPLNVTNSANLSHSSLDPKAVTAVVLRTPASQASWLWIGLGGGCLIMGAGLFLLSWSRRRPRVSSITQSMRR